MKLLIIGGTLFIGRAVVEAALACNHEVTLFHRGKSNPDVFPHVERMIGNRDDAHDLDQLRGRTWDAVIDLPGYKPDSVRMLAELLRGSVDQYVFMSSQAVYDYSLIKPSYVEPQRPDEHFPLRRPDALNAPFHSAEHYGYLKLQCEQAVQQIMGDANTTILRAGIVAGPHDTTDRLTYWLMRLARGGEVLAPSLPDQPIQIIDARDLAKWVIRLVEAHVHGVFNAAGQAAAFCDVLSECHAAIDADSILTWVDEAFLLSQGVRPQIDLPLWVPLAESGSLDIDTRKASAAGLHLRPLAATAYDTYQWASQRPLDRKWQVGLQPDREAALLSEWNIRA